MEQVTEPRGEDRNEKLFVSIKEACDISNIGRSSMYRLISEKRVEAVKVGRRTLVVVESLRTLPQRCEPFAA